MKKSNDYPGEKVRQRHLAFIHANVEQLAAAAHKGFISEGRGMVVLSDEAFVDKPAGTLIKYGVGYMAEGNDLYVASGNKFPGAKEARWVKTYSPESAMLICFVRDADGGTSSYRVGLGKGVPENAYKRSIANQN